MRGSIKVLRLRLRGQSRETKKVGFAIPVFAYPHVYYHLSSFFSHSQESGHRLPNSLLASLFLTLSQTFLPVAHPPPPPLCCAFLQCVFALSCLSTPQK